MHGAVAQLGERLNGIQEVRDSIPLGSTTLRLRLRVAGPAKAGAVGVSAEALAKAELRFGEGSAANLEKRLREKGYRL